MLTDMAVSAAVVWVFMTLLFLAALARKDNSLVDRAWDPGFILLTAAGLVVHPDWTSRRLLLSGLVLVWAARLSLHIFHRNRKRGEDFRYAAWRARWGRAFILRSYLQIFMLQGFFLVLITLLLRFVSGVPLLERKYAGRADFAAYAREVHAFLPWISRRSKPPSEGGVS
jgi:steroid 5-alpha reductase family enzyme